MARKTLTQWQVLVIEQLLEHAHEFNRYDPASLDKLVKLWRGADSITVKTKESKS